MNKTSLNVRTLVECAVMIAITVLMGTTPLGTIRTPFLTASIVTVPVAIAAIIIGPIGGLTCGAAFGITSLINAMTGTSGMLTILFGINPFGVAFTALVPRILEGVLVAYIFKALKKVKGMKEPAYYIASVCCPLLNTLLFMTCIVLFFYKSDYVQGLVTKFGATNPFNFVIALVGVQGLIEAGVALVLGGTISLALAKAFKR